MYKKIAPFYLKDEEEEEDINELEIVEDLILTGPSDGIQSINKNQTEGEVL